MTCHQFEPLAIPYLDGKLPPAQRKAVEMHLADCASCTERVQGFSAVSSVLEEWKNIEPSPWFDARLEQRLARQKQASVWLDRWIRPVWLVPLRFPAAVLAVLVLVSVVVIRTGDLPGPEQETASEQVAPMVTVTAANVDEVALYQSLPVLENWELLRNFEVLQELGSATP